MIIRRAPRDHIVVPLRALHVLEHDDLPVLLAWLSFAEGQEPTVAQIAERANVSALFAGAALDRIEAADIWGAGR